MNDMERMIYDEAKNYCKDWPEAIYHRNDLVGFYIAGARWALEHVKSQCRYCGEQQKASEHKPWCSHECRIEELVS